MLSCIHGQNDLAKVLIESSLAGDTPEPIDVDCKDHRGLTPLNCAAIKGDLELMKILIEKGRANIEEQSPKGCSALMYAS